MIATDRHASDKYSRRRSVVVGASALAVLAASVIYLVRDNAPPDPSTLGPSNDMLAAADIDKGREIAHECIVCHSIEPGAPHRIGPNLHGIVGAKIASRTGFEYSYALQKSRDKTWTIDNLDHWIKDPGAFISESKMVFRGLPDPQDRMDLIAYLMTLK